MSRHRYSRLRHWSGRSNKAWGRLAAVLMAEYDCIPSSRAHCTCCGVCWMCRPSGWIGWGRAVTADWRILGLWVWLVACSNPFVVWHSMCGPLGYAATCARRGPSILIAQAGPQAHELRSKIIRSRTGKHISSLCASGVSFRRNCPSAMPARPFLGPATTDCMLRPICT